MPHGSCWRPIFWPSCSRWVLCFYFPYRSGPVCSALFLLSGSWHLGIAATDSADTPTGVSRLASRCRWLAVVESGGGLAARAAAAGQSGVAADRGTAFFVCAMSDGSGRSVCCAIRRRRMCTDACGFGSSSVGVGGRHQNSVQGDRQHIRVVEGVMQAATFLALHG